MYRRRRPPRSREVPFSFDSFLDIVANVIGVIIRLILVAWVGARSYTESMKTFEPEPPPPLAAKVAQVEPAREQDDPLHPELGLARKALDEARAMLADKLKSADEHQAQVLDLKASILRVAAEQRELSDRVTELDRLLAEKGTQVKLASVTAEQLQQRSQEIRDEISKIQSIPSQKKALRYHTPVSRTVDSEELFFECKAGRVTFIDLKAFLREVENSRESLSRKLAHRGAATETYGPIGAFQMRFTVERKGPVLDGRMAVEPSWTLEAVALERGETLLEAASPRSDFRQIVDRLEPGQTVVTFWVYPDSFELFRHLRDHLYQRGVEVAGRPLLEHILIGGSSKGRASRGQ